ncbi:Plexin-B [Nymphon striatum]|nr:Plexin-B [Nymphon striatum]
MLEAWKTRWKQPSMAINILFLLIVLTDAYSNRKQIQTVFKAENRTINFTHVAYDHVTGRIYVGAINRLYQLNSSLDMEMKVITGPEQDSVRCPATGCTDSTITLRTTSNINKLLVIDHHNEHLIVCGTIRQGACRTHQLNNIQISGQLTRFPVVANDKNSTTYAFIAPATYMPHEKRALYVGATITKLGTYRDLIPAICSRSLVNDPVEMLQTIDNSITVSARMEINRLYRDYFIVYYKYGFHSNGFAYFATVQRKSHLRDLEEEGYISRLSRVCVSDAEYKTYTEVTLQCFGADGTYYNLLQDASVVKAGSSLASEFNIPNGGDVFVGVFAKSHDHTITPENLSAICVYSVADIEQKFNENIHTCYNGTSRTRNMAYIAGSVNQCPEPGEHMSFIEKYKEKSISHADCLYKFPSLPSILRFYKYSMEQRALLMTGFTDKESTVLECQKKEGIEGRRSCGDGVGGGFRHRPSTQGGKEVDRKELLENN